MTGWFKKIVVSAVVVVGFVGYALTQRKTAASDTILTPSPAQTTTNTTTLTTSAAPTTDTLSSSPSPSQMMTTMPMQSGAYKNGTYTGSVADAFYGNIQVRVTISNGKISNVEFLQSPNDRGESIQINRQAMPLLKQEAIQAQSASIDGVSGASASSQAFIESLQSALSQAS